jgi:hypothetical protein
VSERSGAAPTWVFVCGGAAGDTGGDITRGEPLDKGKWAVFSRIHLDL